MAGVRKKLNFVNEVTEIPATQMKCPKGRSARKEKSNFGNQVAKNEGGKICGNQVAKIVGEEREKFNRNFGNQVAQNGKKKKKELWQPSCQNCRGGERILIGILAMKLPKMEKKEKKKKCGKLAMDLPKIGGVNCLCLILILQRLK